MKNIKILFGLVLLFSTIKLKAQITTVQNDSLDNNETVDRPKAKVLHAEPLFIDLIRDLGARKGEKEWNVGLGLTDKLGYDSYEALIEYEWAPMDRLGVEVELPFTFYSPVNNTRKDSLPFNRLNSLKLAAQWTFLVHEPKGLSMALGYIHEFEMSDFGNFGRPLVSGNLYNPFFVLAKRLNNNFHSLLYTGPKIEHHFSNADLDVSYEMNTNLHYMISGTRNFIGFEFNKSFKPGDFDMTIRPQMRISLTHNLMVGIVAGIPIKRENERLSSFVRLIWEPAHKKSKMH